MTNEAAEEERAANNKENPFYLKRQGLIGLYWVIWKSRIDPLNISDIPFPKGMLGNLTCFFF